MEVAQWVAKDWFDLLQTVCIIGGLFFTAYTVRKDARARKIDNTIAIANHHREIWKELYARPELSRILDKTADILEEPISNHEHLFVTSLILHLDSVHRAMKVGMFVTLEGLQADIRSFFLLPIPQAIWEKTKPLQNKEFVDFIEACVRE